MGFKHKHHARRIAYIERLIGKVNLWRKESGGGGGANSSLSLSQ
jgi:hypothetical protein